MGDVGFECVHDTAPAVYFFLPGAGAEASCFLPQRERTHRVGGQADVAHFLQLAEQFNLPEHLPSKVRVVYTQNGTNQLAARSGVEADGIVFGVGSLAESGHGLIGVCKAPKQAFL